MPRIPVGDQGYRVAQPVGGARATPGAFGIGDGVSNIGKELGNIASDMQRREDIDAKKRMADLAAEDEKARRNRAAAGFAQYQVDITRLSEDLNTRLSEGQVTREAATTEYTNALKDIKKRNLGGLDPGSMAALQDNIIKFDGMAGIRFEDGIKKNLHRERAGNFTTMLESLQRLAVTDRKSATEQAQAAFSTEGAALFGADGAAKGMQQFRERVAVTHWSNQTLAAKNNLSALKQVEAGIQGDNDLDPDKKVVLGGRVMAMQDTLMAKAERAQASRMRTLGREIDKANNLTLMGYDVPADRMLALQQAAKGTELEGDVRQMVAFSNESARFRSMNPKQQETYLNDLEAKVRKSPTPETVQFLDKLKGIGKAQNEAIKTDSLSFAEQKGLTEVTSINLGDALKNPAGLKDQLAARLDVARGVQARYGGPLHVLKKEEAEALPDLLNGMPPQQKAEALKVIGGAIGDPVAMRDLAVQIHSKDKGLATAMFLAAKDLRGTKGSNVAEQYLIGQDAIRSKTAKIDDKAEVGLRAEITQKLDGVYASNAARDMAVDVAVKLWASGRVTDNGFDNVSRAIDMATGGVMKFNGHKVAKPYGWSDGQFRAGVEKIDAQALAKYGDTFMVGGQKLKAEDIAKSLPSARLQTVGDGRYAVIAGTDYVRTADRQPLVIEVR